MYECKGDVFRDVGASKKWYCEMCLRDYDSREEAEECCKDE